MRGDYARRISLYCLVISVFMLGWLMSGFVAQADFDMEKPFSSLFTAREVSSPSDHISKDKIHVYDDRIVIDLKGAQWAEFTDSNSMDPILDAEANSFEITPSTTGDINVGDIISYKPDNYNGLIVHRVIDIGSDSKGWFAVVKGDNLRAPDAEKVRFSQINGLLVGIIY